MKMIDIPTAVFKAPSSCAADEGMLKRYAASLIEDNIPYLKRVRMLDMAKQFLGWWREQYVGDEYCITRDNWPTHESAWWDMRENYLRHACPDHSLRAEDRSQVNQFLIYIALCEVEAYTLCEMGADRVNAELH